MQLLRGRTTRVGGLLLAAGLSLLMLFQRTIFLNERRSTRADFTFANGADPKSLDPAKASGSVEGKILRAVLEGLTSPHPKTLEPLPAAAERWEIRPDGKHYAFHVRPDARWSNGDAVTANDFAWSWARLLAGGQYQDLLWSVVNARRFSLGEVPWEDVGIKVPTARVLEVELLHPVPYFLELTSYYPLFPLHRESVEAAESRGESFTRPDRFVSNGPFLLRERRLRDRIRLAKNPDYWDAAAVEIETIDVLAVESPNTQLNLFLAGAVDWTSEVPRAVVPALGRDPAYAGVYRPTPYLATYFYRFNVTRPPLDRLEVRRALSLATDRQEIVDRVTQAGEEPAWSFVPWPPEALRRYALRVETRTGVSPGVPVPFAWYERALDSYVAPAGQRDWGRRGYDPAAAREIVRALGYRVPERERGGSRFTFTEGEAFPRIEILYNSSHLHERVAEVVQAQWWRELGIEVSLTHQEWGSYLNSQQRLDYGISRSIWIGDYLDPSTFLEVFLSASPNNRTGWQNLEYDRLLAQARDCVDRHVRAQHLHAAETVLLSELPIIPLYYCVTAGMVSDRVEGIGGNLLNVLVPKHLSRRGRR